MQQNKPKERPLFDELCSEKLEKAIRICRERGDEYGDTLRNGQWLIIAAVRRRLSDVPDCRDKDRCLTIAGLCDVKYQRWEGGFKLDHIDDNINYQSVLPALMEICLNMIGDTLYGTTD